MPRAHICWLRVFLQLTDDMAFDNEIHIGSQPDWYRFDDAASRTRMSEKEFFAQSWNSNLMWMRAVSLEGQYGTPCFAVSNSEPVERDFP